MSVPNVTNVAGVGQSGWRSTIHQAGQDFEQLFQAMQAGNLSAAQQAYAALQQLQAGNASTTIASTGTAATDASATSTTGTAAVSASATTSAANSVSSDWTALGQALQSGSLTSAQSAFSQLEQDLKSAGQGQGHHHHHPAVDNAQAVYSAMQIGNATSASGAAASTATGNQAGSVGSDLKALQQALQSGDTSSAQSLLTKLEQDLQASGQGAAHAHHHRHSGFALQNSAAAYVATPATPSTPATPAVATVSAGTSAAATA